MPGHWRAFRGFGEQGARNGRALSTGKKECIRKII